jgi:hypothetical protein
LTRILIFDFLEWGWAPRYNDDSAFLLQNILCSSESNSYPGKIREVGEEEEKDGPRAYLEKRR